MELGAKATELEFKVKETRHIVDHFGDSLVLSSTQITVESSVGFSKRPMSLYDILKGAVAVTQSQSQSHSHSICLSYVPNLRSR